MGEPSGEPSVGEPSVGEPTLEGASVGEPSVEGVFVDPVLPGEEIVSYINSICYLQFPEWECLCLSIRISI